MRQHSKLHKLIIPVIILFLVVITAFGSFYGYWDSASPSKTCSSCHEITSSVEILAESPHRNLACKECHGTAFSNGMHSLKEKGKMIFEHINGRSDEDIRLNEAQILEVMNNCTRCHKTEQARWLSGGHSARYKDIFLNEKHNKTEQLNFDCLRCHGMFSDLNIGELIGPLNTSGPWKIKINSMESNPVIPCLACHQIHLLGSTHQNPDYSNPQNASYNRITHNPVVSFYNRHDKTHIPAENLPLLEVWDCNRPVNVSSDPIMRNCIQCHAPNGKHEAGTSDDRTPRGVHEGFSCTACHDPHSNDARQSCAKCHPAVSHCKLDVTTMNTSYKDRQSPHNIHWVSCTDCHINGRPLNRQKR